MIQASVLHNKGPIRTDKPVIVYIGDPMCSWCYGIAEELSMTTEHYEGRLDKKLVVGGLRPGGGDEWNDQFKDFLRHHWEEVGERSGAKFSYKLLDQLHFNYDTEPACRAVVIVKDIASDKAFDFFKMVQKGFYLDNKDPKQVEFYHSICEQLQIDYTHFKRAFEDRAYIEKTKQDFEYARKVGVNSFPTVLLEKEGQLFMVAQGYATATQMQSRIDDILNVK